MDRQEKKNLISDFINENCVEYIERKYSKEYSELMDGNISGELRKTLSTCSHNRDKRDIVEYAQDILLNWVLEDSVYDLIDKVKNVRVVKSGADKQRKFLEHKKISGKEDFSIFAYENKINLEMICDFYGFWDKHRVAHLRDSKFEKLKEKSKKELVCLLAFDIKNKRYALIKITPDFEAKEIEHHRAFGFKKAQEISFENITFYSIKDFKKLFGEQIQLIAKK